MRKVSYRVDILRGGIPFGTLRFYEPPRIMASRTAVHKMTMQGMFLHEESMDYINDELRPVMIVDGVEYPLGVYIPVTKNEQISSAGTVVDTIEAYDRSIRCSWAKLETRDFWQSGTPYESIISQYLIRAGIKYAIPVPSAAVLQTDREDWDIGTDFLTIINTLLQEINYNELWFDLSGAARMTPYTAPNASNISHRYGGTDGVGVICGPYSGEIDLYNTPNVFIGILENPEYEKPIVKTAENNTPSSRLSTVSRGIRIPEVYYVSNVASEEDLQAYVDRLRDESVQMSEYVDIQTANMPGHEIGDIVAINHGRLVGIFREEGWSMTLQAGAYMAHTLQRVVIQ